MPSRENTERESIYTKLEFWLLAVIVVWLAGSWLIGWEFVIPIVAFLAVLGYVKRRRRE